MPWILFIVLAFCVTIGASCHLDWYLSEHYTSPSTRQHFPAYTLWSHSYCGMLLMTWLAAIYNVRCLAAPSRKGFPILLPLLAGVLVAGLLGLTLYLRTMKLHVALNGEGIDVPCVPIDRWFHVACFAPPAFVALGCSVALKLQALDAIGKGKAASLLDSLIESMLLEVGLLVFVVLEIALIWKLHAQCDASFIADQESGAYGVAWQFAGAASMGMLLVVGLPSAVAMLVARASPPGDAAGQRQFRKALLALIGSVVPAVIATFFQS